MCLSGHDLVWWEKIAQRAFAYLGSYNAPALINNQNSKQSFNEHIGLKPKFYSEAVHCLSGDKTVHHCTFKSAFGDRYTPTFNDYQRRTQGGGFGVYTYLYPLIDENYQSL